MSSRIEKTLKIVLPSGEEIDVRESEFLRESLKPNLSEIYHKDMEFINCRGFGTCGTCAMKIEGAVTPPTRIERWRLNFPPHKDSLSKGIRLICQCKPLSNLKLMKLSGRWGQGDD